MTTEWWINSLSIAVLVFFLIALIYLIVVLHRANRILSKLDDFSAVMKTFVHDIVPAIVNVGAITTAVHSVLKALVDHHTNKSTKKSARD